MNDKAYYPYFDYLRLILASIVMFSHDGLIAWEYSGQLAVDVFFALSGWLIGGLLLKFNNTKELPRFYFNRAIRIWIPYYIALVFIIIASLMKDPIDLKWAEFIAYKITWVYNIYGTPQLYECIACMPLDGTANHFWSVNAEEQFYLLAPLVLVVFKSIGRSVATWVLIVLVLWLTDSYVSISFGVLAALLNYRFVGFNERPTSKFLIVFLILATATGLYVDDKYYLYAPIFAISTVLLLTIRGEKRAFSSFLGGISYPLYLNHWIGIFFFNLALEPYGLRDSNTRYFLSAVMNYAIAGVLYWYVEKRVLALRAKLFTTSRAIALCHFAYLSILSGLTLGLLLSTRIDAAVLLLIFLSAYVTAYILVIKKQKK
ncbi:MAG: peptidoglycan/LPS O-acetylase OafA/YrhL [Parvicella sp.]|jgi:peptidoglycan/LPS O-acetylase OafA/YrhL